MQAKNSWGFTERLRDIDVPRILKEAGPQAKLVRFKIATKTYTAVNTAWLDRQGYAVQWVDETGSETPCYTDETGTVKVCRRNKQITVEGNGTGKWAIIQGDKVANFLDGVKVKVDVF